MNALPVIKQNIRIRGEFDLDIAKIGADGVELSRRRALSGCKNLITDTGMDRFGTSSFNSFTGFLQVGTSNTAPDETDTALGGRVAGVAGSSYSGSSWAWDTTNNKVAVLSRTYTFGVGVAAGVLAEIGLSSTINGTLSTRALFVDDEGNPITVTVLSDEQLIATYRLYFEVSESDSTLVVTQKGVEYTLTLRPASLGVDLALFSSAPNGDNLSAFSGNNTTAGNLLYSGGSSDIGPVTGVPTGTQALFSTPYPSGSYGSYTNGDHYRDDKLSVSLGSGNVANVGAYLFPQGAPFRMQVGISPRVSKTSSDLMSFTIRVSWSRG